MNQTVEIKMAAPSDAVSITTVLSAAFAEYEHLYTTRAYAATTAPASKIKARFDEGQTWIALLDEKIVGTISAVSQKQDLYIRSMAVLPSARGRKIGERLLIRIEDFAVENGCRRLTLSTTPFLSRAIRLYENFGFVFTGTDDLFGTLLLTMEKKMF